MGVEDKLIGKRILIVDDEEDVLEALSELLHMCKIDTASSFEDAKNSLANNDYHVAILDIMGVNGFELLKIANSRNVPAIMLTAHGLSEGNLVKAAEEGAAYYAPKDKISEIAVFVSDVMEAEGKSRGAWTRMMERLGSFYDKRFGGTDWREKESEYWKSYMESHKGI